MKLNLRLRPPRSLLVATLVIAGLIFGMAPALASHFRASQSTLSYDSSGHVLTWNIATAWRKSRDDQMLYGGGDITVTDQNGSDVTSDVTSNLVSSTDDTSNPLYDANLDIATMDISNLVGTPGTYTAFVSNCCRVGGVQNTDGNDDFSQAVSWVVNSDGSVTLPPTFTDTSLYALLPLGSTGSFSQSFASTDPQGESITYSQMNDPSDPDDGATELPCSSFVDGVLTVKASLCSNGDVYSDVYQPGYFFAIKVKATDAAGAFTETDMLLRVPTTPTPVISSITPTADSAQVAITATDTVVDTYSVTCTNVNDSTDEVTASSPTQPVTVQGLQPATDYDCIATATNGAGSGVSDDVTTTTNAFQDQTISFPAPGEVHLTDSPVAMTATSDSGLPVTFTSSTPNVCTVTGAGSVTLVSPGTCSIAAEQAGDDSYSPAAQVVRSFLVKPAAPQAPGTTSTGRGPGAQTTQLTVPSGDTVTLVDSEGNATDTVTIPSEGTFTLDPATGVVTFTPVNGWTGTAPVTYRVNDGYGQSTDGTFTATVAKPAAPAARQATSQGAPTQPQHIIVSVPSNGTVTLLNAAGDPVTSVSYPNQGTYRIDPATGVVTFTPAHGFTGSAHQVTYRVTDAYGQSADGLYGAQVRKLAPTATPGRLKLAGKPATNGRALPVTCAQTAPAPAARVMNCLVTAYAEVDGHLVKIGMGRAASRTGTHSLPLRVALNHAGRALAARPGGVAVRLVGDFSLGGLSGMQTRTAHTRVVSHNVRLRPVLFRFNSAELTTHARTMLVAVRHEMRLVRVITCDGWADYAGSRAHETALSRQRARVVCAVLGHGNTVRTRIVAHGPTHRFADGGSAVSRKGNRRVQVTLGY